MEENEKNVNKGYDPYGILDNFIKELDEQTAEEQGEALAPVIVDDDAATEAKEADSKESEEKSDEGASDGFSDFEKEVSEASEKAAREMTEEELNDIIEKAKQNSMTRPQEKKTAPYLKEFPADYVNAYAETAKAEGKVYSIADAYISSLATLGKVNIEYISALSQKSAREVIDELTSSESIFQNPETWNENFAEGWETANEYLSGNLFLKKKSAVAACEKYGSLFDRNVAALTALFRDKIPSENIYATLGSPWIPASVYNDFFYQTFHPRYKRKDGIYYDDIVKCWKITYSISTGYDVKGMTAVEILERTLNNRPIVIYYKSTLNAAHRQVDRFATMQATDVQKTLVSLFKDWLFKDEERKAELEQLYFETFGSITARKFNGSFLDLPGKNPEVTLYKHQLDAIARIIMTPSTLLAHAVGTGKTYIMIAAGMEMRRTGLSKKNMYVVPNAILGQWEEDFKTLYPSSTLYVVKEGALNAKNKERTMKTLKEGDFDAILIPYSIFEMVPAGYASQIAEQRERIRQVGNDSKYNAIKTACFKKIAELEKKRNESPNEITFEDLSVTSLFVDEAHNFKNVSVALNANQLGLTRGGAKIADDMFTKVRIVRKGKNAKSIVFATGTPITNSITELFVMQSYLQPEDLKFLKLDTFDNWALTFAECSNNFEIDVDSSHYRIVERFNRFHNLPELTNLFAGVADFHLEEIDEIYTQKVDYQTIVVQRSPEQAEYIKSLADRTEAVRSHLADRTQDNLLKITVDGRKAALDIRLVDPTAMPAYTKVDHCADVVYRIYKERPQVTQLVFCDNSTPKGTFNVYDALKSALLARGIPSDEIEFIQTAKSRKKKQALYDCMNYGAIKVLIGSTQTLGTGVNVQKKLYAVHHLDVPWKPSEMVQREGRMLRQGNENDNVEIYRYVTAGSFDSYSWQLLESKQKFICQLLSGSFDERDGDELNELVLTYAEIKALAIGDPKIKERVETANEMDRLKLLKASKLARREYLGGKLEDLPKTIESKKALVNSYREDYRTVSAYQKGNYKEVGEAILRGACNPPKTGEFSVVATYRGIDVLAPDVFYENSPRVILNGSYQKLIYLKNSEGVMLSPQGVMQRIDDYYDKLVELIQENTKYVFEKEKELSQVKDELSADLGDLDAEIQRLKAHIDELDEALGVDKDE